MTCLVFVLAVCFVVLVLGFLDEVDDQEPQPAPVVWIVVAAVAVISCLTYMAIYLITLFVNGAINAIAW